MPKVVNIYTESSPNPNSVKFVLDFPLLDNLSFDFPSKEEAKLSPIAQAIFEKFSFVKRVFIATNFISITKDDVTDWFEVSNDIKEFIRVYIVEENPLFTEDIKQEIDKQDLTEHEEETSIDAKIKTILKDYVQPAVEQDGGAIQFKSFDEGVVTVELQGACSGCPSSTATLKGGIENLLTRMIPEVKEVVAEGV